jgi:hypothetical protein
MEEMKEGSGFSDLVGESSWRQKCSYFTEKKLTHILRMLGSLLGDSEEPGDNTFSIMGHT